MRIGVDIGGTKIEVIVLGATGEQLVRHRVTSPRESYLSTLTIVRDLINSAETRAKLIEKPNNLATIGVGIPGTISSATGLVKNANSTWLIGHKLDQDLADMLNRPVRIENDANCFALSEAIDGAASEQKIVFAAILGTGVGGAICVDLMLLQGINKICGEWGHNPLPWPSTSEDGQELEGVTCYCGKNSCIETLLSGEGLRRSYAKLSGQEIPYTHSAAEIHKLSGEADVFATLALELYASRLAKSLAGVINIIDPDVIVLGGGLSNIQFLYERVPQLWSQWVFSDKTNTRLVKNQHGDSSGVRGAARLWPEPEK